MFGKLIFPGSRLFGKLIFPGSRAFGKLIFPGEHLADLEHLVSLFFQEPLGKPIFPGSRALGRLILAGSTGGQSELQRFLKDFNAKRAEGVSKNRLFLSVSELF